MNFNNTNNNAREQVNVNTRGPQFMNKNGFDPSTMAVGYWNELISIKMHPALPKEKQTDSKVFDYEKVISTAITLEKATTLCTGIEKKIIPAIEKGEQASVGIPVGADSLIVVSTGVKMTGSVRPYIAIHKALDEKTKKPETSIFYEFNRAYSVDDYDEAEGTFQVTQDIHSEFKLFIELLNAAKLGLSQAIAHSMRVVDKYYRDRVLNDISAIAEKLGVTTGGAGRTFYSKKNNMFSNGSSDGGSTGGDEASVQSLQNISEIDEFLG